MSSLRTGLSFASTALVLWAQLGTISQSSCHLLAIDRFPNFNGGVLGGTLVGLVVDAAVGVALFFSGVEGPGADQCASLDVYTSLITWPRLIVDSRNLETHSLRSSTSLA